jgi:hypothetical protein
MAWFVMQHQRKTWTKFLVEAASEQGVLETDDHENLGYLDADDESCDIVGPFETREMALKDVASYVDG